MLDSRPRGHGLEPHQRHCVVSLSKNINPSLVLVQPRKTSPFITEILLMGRKESNQTKQHIPWELMSVEEFQGGCTGIHLGYSNRTILAILNLLVQLNAGVAVLCQ